MNNAFKSREELMRILKQESIWHELYLPYGMSCKAFSVYCVCKAVAEIVSFYIVQYSKSKYLATDNFQVTDLES